MYGAFKFHFVGTCASDPEYSTLSSGTQRCVIAVAVNTPHKERDGQFKEKTAWVRVAFFGENSQKKSLTFCRKGTPVYVEGDVLSYQEDIGGRKYTMYNFRPNLIRPLASKQVIDEQDRQPMPEPVDRQLRRSSQPQQSQRPAEDGRQEAPAEGLPMGADDDFPDVFG